MGPKIHADCFGYPPTGKLCYLIGRYPVKIKFKTPLNSNEVRSRVLCCTRGNLRTYSRDPSQKNVANSSHRVERKQRGEVCVGPESRYGPEDKIYCNFLLVKPPLHEVIKEVGKVCIAPWGRYGPRGVTPSNFLVKYP